MTRRRQNRSRFGRDSHPLIGEDTFVQLKWISDKYRHLHDERRRYEIKFLFAALTLLVLTAGAFLTGQANVHVPQSFAWTLVWLVVVWFSHLSLAALTWLYLLCLHESNRKDMRIAKDAEDRVLVAHRIDPRECIRSYSRYFQMAALFLVAIIGASVVTLQLLSPSLPRSEELKQQDLNGNSADAGGDQGPSNWRRSLVGSEVQFASG